MTVTTETLATTDLEFARQLGQQLRVDSIRCSTAAGSGHPTSSMSSADIIAVLIARYLQYDWNKPKDPNNDHLIFSKGHASPLCYAMFKAVGAITDTEMMTFRKFGSRMQGHPTPAIPWIDVATGSLGQGLPVSVGVALAGKNLDNLPFHVWTLCGDSELAEGSIWEALDKAGHYQLSNLTAILDINRLGQRGETEFGWNLDPYRRRVEAFGCFPIVIDGEVSNSTHADEFAKAHPERFFEMWIAEQQLVATAVGMSVRGYVPFASTFAAFFSRAYDFIRMAGISEANIRLVGSHAGVEIGQDGPSQMALEDLASMRAIIGSTVLYPSDPNQTAKLTKVMAETPGIVFMRTTRGAYPTLHGARPTVQVGGAKVLRQSPKDKVALIGAGVTLHNCIAAADALAAKKIPVRVIDLYSIKPVDVKTLRDAARVTKGRLIVVEDHYPEGGIGAAVLEALAADPPLRLVHPAVKGLPESGKPEELMNAAGISAKSIVAAATKLAQAK